MNPSGPSHLILASASPRRRQLLQQIGVRFSVLPVDIDESVRPGEASRDYVLRMAETKARGGHQRQPGALPVLGADTTVVLEGSIFGKPVGRADALTMLMALSGRTHSVLSAVVVVKDDRCESKLSETKVTFRALQQSECLDYWNTGEPADKAGAYAIQGKGAVFVEHLAGSFSGVVGLPLVETCDLLKLFGIPWWVQPEAQQR